jgi:hypothetical protein
MATNPRGRPRSDDPKVIPPSFRLRTSILVAAEEASEMLGINLSVYFEQAIDEKNQKEKQKKHQRPRRKSRSTWATGF